MTSSKVRKIALVGFLVLWLITTAVFYFSGEIFWFSLWLAIIALVGTHEIVAVLVAPNKTISTRFTKLSERNPKLGWVLIGLMFISWMFLLIHLRWT